ncbi:MAG: hypothetical protein JNJ54_35520 [Myxococcaceae bacterium]|nr:hypothetical protein [Myxococcaceae bacterium]
MAESLSALPPHLRYRFAETKRLLPKLGEAPSDVALSRLELFIDDALPWLAAQPELIAFGLELLDARQVPQLREHGAHWLTQFPTLETVDALAAVARDASAPLDVRNQAVWSLGYRQRRNAHRALLWKPEVVAAADAALAELLAADAKAGKVTLEKLPLAARHARSDVVFRALAQAPALFGDAMECFADEALAQALLDQLAQVSPKHRLRSLRLIAATLGSDGIPALQEALEGAELDDRLEGLYLSVAFGDDDAKDELRKLMEGAPFAKLFLDRMAWHEQHAGVVPTVRGLQVVRVTAEQPVEATREACGQAADDLGALTRFARHPEAYLYTMWAWAVRGSADPARARTLAVTHPESEPIVRKLHFLDLARRGRVRQLQAAAQGASGGDFAAFQLAVHGRPMAALELAGTTRRMTPAVVAARVLGCYRAGRADLAERLLKDDLPPAELVSGDELPPFPGPHEQWMAEHAPDVDPALTALVKGRDALLSLAQGPADEAEPDQPTLDGTQGVARRLFRGLPGTTVFFVGEFKTMNKDALRAAVTKAGAREVHGPFPDTDYYLMGDWADVTTIATLERQGTRRLRRGEVEGL